MSDGPYRSADEPSQPVHPMETNFASIRIENDSGLGMALELTRYIRSTFSGVVALEPITFQTARIWVTHDTDIDRVIAFVVGFIGGRKSPAIVKSRHGVVLSGSSS